MLEEGSQSSSFFSARKCVCMRSCVRFLIIIISLSIMCVCVCVCVYVCVCVCLCVCVTCKQNEHTQTRIWDYKRLSVSCVTSLGMEMFLCQQWIILYDNWRAEQSTDRRSPRRKWFLLSVFLFSECSIRKLFLLGDSLLFVSGQIQSQLVSWCFEPSQPQRITSGLNTNFTLSPSYSFHESSYRKSCFFVGFFAYLYSVGTQHGNLHPAGWPILVYGPKQKPMLATANAGKNLERSGKHAGEWTGRVE